MTDFLDTKVQEIEARLRELQPLIDEFHRLEAAAAALKEAQGAQPKPRADVRRVRRRRRTISSARMTQALETLRERPGITISELAEEMDVRPSYLYRVLPVLEQEGLVERHGRAWVAAGGDRGGP